MRVLIAAGGTAGHINPALAIAGALKAADPTAEIHFAGRREGMEYGLVTKAGYPFHHIEINGFQRHLSLENIGRNIVAIWHLALSGPRTRKILNEVKPDLVIGCGGYVSGPIVRAAARRGIKTAIPLCSLIRQLYHYRTAVPYPEHVPESDLDQDQLHHKNSLRRSS